jgi:iron complex outermembrane receptor protein
MLQARNILRFSASVVAMGLAQPAMAQRTDDNAVAAAEDAFGKSVGDSAIGIYNIGNVRGFSPLAAGNVRIEGLYYDQQGGLTGRLQKGSTIRVGISAQSYAFPAPTGIADLSLRKPGTELIASTGLNFGPWNGKSAELDLQIPLDSDRLGVIAGIGVNRDGRSYGGTPKDLTVAWLLRYAPRPNSELMAFYSRARNWNNEAQPLIFTNGTFLPKRVPRGRFLGQDWNDYSATAADYGVVAKTVQAGFDVQLGIFRSIFDNDVSTADLLFGTERDGGVSQRIIVRQPDNKSASASGELRISRAFTEGPRRHVLISSIRGRRLNRRYGAAATIDLGPSRSDVPDRRPNQETTDGPLTRDRVRQKTFGLAYQGKWVDVGELGIGIQKTDYLKRITHADQSVILPDTRDSPWLPSATAAIHLTSRLALYGGYTRGLEESPVAPIDAVNRNEAPPAIRTEQMDAGIRWTISPGITAVAGLFEVAKPYFNVDSTGRFRQIGMVTNRGIEFSLAGQIAPGLNLVAGNVLLDATLSGEEVTSGLIGKRPVGAFVRQTILSVDYRLPWNQALSVDAGVEGTSKRTANAANTLTIPARTQLSIGGRYRFRIGKAPALIRAQIGNLTNAYGWDVGSSGFFTPLRSRRIALSLAADW